MATPPADTWTPPVYQDQVDFDCAVAACVPRSTGWETAASQLQAQINQFMIALGRPDRLEITGAIDTPTFALAQALGRVIVNDWKYPTTTVLTLLASAGQPFDIAPYVTHLAVDFSQGTAVALQKSTTAKARRRLPRYLIAGGGALMAIGGTIALIAAASKRRTRHRRS